MLHSLRFVSKRISQPCRFYSQSGNLIHELEKSSRVQNFKQALQQDGRVQIPVQEFYNLAAQNNFSKEETTELLKHFHASSTVLYFDQHDTLSHFVILQPEKAIHQMWNVLDQKMVSIQIDDEVKTVQDLYQQLLPLRERKAELDQKAKQNLHFWLYAGLGYLTIQMGTLARITWVDYGWDVAEPISYFLTFSTALLGYVYFIVFKNEYTYADAQHRLISRAQQKIYNKAKFDVEKYYQLEEEYETARKALQARATDVYGATVPPTILHVLYPQLHPTIASTTTPSNNNSAGSKLE